MLNDQKLRNFLATGVNYLDEDQLEAWVGLFEENGLYRVTTKESVRKNYPASIIYCDGRDMLEDRVMALRTANIYEPHTYTHVLSLPIVDEREGSCSVETRFIVTRIFEDGRSDVFATGKYLDEIVETQGEYRFKSRTVVLDSRAIDVLLVIPL